MGVLERLEGGYDDYRDFIATDFKAYLSGLGFVPRDLISRDGQQILLAAKGPKPRSSAGRL